MLSLPENWVTEVKKRLARLGRLRSSFLPEENQLIVLAVAVGVSVGAWVGVCVAVGAGAGATGPMGWLLPRMTSSSR